MTEPSTPCPVPECRAGFIRVPEVHMEVHRDRGGTFASMVDVPCSVCRGKGELMSSDD